MVLADLLALELWQLHELGFVGRVDKVVGAVLGLESAGTCGRSTLNHETTVGCRYHGCINHNINK